MIDILQGLTPPPPEATRAARLAAGLSQAQAAALAGLGDRTRWAEYETGARTCDVARWAIFLLAVGQHPTLQVLRARESE